MCVPGIQAGQKRVSDPLKLELQAVVSHRECWESILGPKEQPVRFPAKPSPGIHYFIILDRNSRPFNTSLALCVLKAC